MSKTLAFLLVTFSLSAFADNHIVVLGGGSEPKEKKTTIFDLEIQTLGTFLSKEKKNWNTEISFNGGHSDTERIIQNGFGKIAPPNKHFTEQNFQNLIKEYERKIDAGEIKSGDQLLVYITTHGAQKTEKELTHKIGMTGNAATDLNTLAGSSLVSMDVLQSLITKAEQRGIRLGIMDFSCHSGASIALKHPNTCIITATGPNHFGYNSWGRRFAFNMKKGKNLEEIYLETFMNRPDSAFPMISTKAGVSIQNEMYELLTPYLLYWEADKMDKLSKFLEAQVLANKCEEANEEFERFISHTLELEKKFPSKKSDIRRFGEALREYHNLQVKMKNDLISFGLQEMSKKEKICTSYSTDTTGTSSISRTACSDWSDKEILTMNFDFYEKHYDEMIRDNTGENRAIYQAYKENVKKARLKKDEILKNKPGYTKYANYYKSIPSLESKTKELATKVSQAYQKVYLELYKEEQKRDPGPNPCREFKL